MNKKILAFALALCLIFSGIVVSASEDSASDSVFSPSDFASFAAAKNDGVMLLNDVSALDYICEKILDFETEIPVYNLAIPMTQTQALINTLTWNYPELFIFDGMSCRVTGDGYLYDISPKYLYSATEGKLKLENFDYTLEKILKDLSDDATDLEKVMYIHDYLALNSRYENGISDAYSFLTEGTGVCQGYALSFCALARKAGLKCIQASSDAQDHIWNLVEVDGEWYHIDVTWDDPVGDRIGHVSYEHFLKSTNKILEVAVDDYGNSREDWQIVGDMAVVCNSERFDSGYAWENDEWPFVKLNGEWYGIKYSSERHITLNKISNDFTTVSEVLDLGGDIHWYVSGNSGYFWDDVYSGFYALGNALFFNTSDSLECIYFENGKLITKKVDISKLTGETALKIYGSYYNKEEGQIVLQYQTSPNDSVHTDYTINIQHLYDLDASCAELLVKVRRFLLNTEKLEKTALFDVNGDGEVNIVDLVRMKKRSAA